MIRFRNFEIFGGISMWETLVIYMVGKKRDVSTLTNFVKKMQFEFHANPKRKATPHIHHIRYIQDVLVKTVNSNLNEKSVTVDIPEYKLKAMKSLSADYKKSKPKK